MNTWSPTISAAVCPASIGGATRTFTVVLPCASSFGFFGVQLSKTVFVESFKAGGMTPAEATAQAKMWGGWYSFMLNVGAAAGMISFGWLAQGANRRVAFALAYLLAGLSTAGTCWYFQHPSDIFWMTPIMGFCLLSLFSLLAIYFPELFPTRLRSTGTSFSQPCSAEKSPCESSSM